MTNNQITWKCFMRCQGQVFTILRSFCGHLIVPQSWHHQRIAGYISLWLGYAYPERLRMGKGRRARTNTMTSFGEIKLISRLAFPSVGVGSVLGRTHGSKYRGRLDVHDQLASCCRYELLLRACLLSSTLSPISQNHYPNFTRAPILSR